MKKDEIQNDDVLYFANGDIVKYSKKQQWILDIFYDENLECQGNSAWDIIKIVRTNEVIIYEKEKTIDFKGIEFTTLKK